MTTHNQLKGLLHSSNLTTNEVKDSDNIHRNPSDSSAPKGGYSGRCKQQQRRRQERGGNQSTNSSSSGTMSHTKSAASPRWLMGNNIIKEKPIEESYEGMSGLMDEVDESSVVDGYDSDQMASALEEGRGDSLLAVVQADHSQKEYQTGIYQWDLIPATRRHDPHAHVMTSSKENRAVEATSFDLFLPSSLGHIVSNNNTNSNNNHLNFRSITSMSATGGRSRTNSQSSQKFTSPMKSTWSVASDDHTPGFTPLEFMDKEIAEDDFEDDEDYSTYTNFNQSRRSSWDKGDELNRSQHLSPRSTTHPTTNISSNAQSSTAATGLPRRAGTSRLSEMAIHHSASYEDISSISNSNYIKNKNKNPRGSNNDNSSDKRRSSLGVPTIIDHNSNIHNDNNGNSSNISSPTKQISSKEKTQLSSSSRPMTREVSFRSRKIASREKEAQNSQQNSLVPRLSFRNNRKNSFGARSPNTVINQKDLSSLLNDESTVDNHSQACSETHQYDTEHDESHHIGLPLL